MKSEPTPGVPKFLWAIDERKCLNINIENSRSSIAVLGKGDKKRAVWINNDFKRKCLLFLGCKKRFLYSLDNESYLLNQGNSLSYAVAFDKPGFAPLLGTREG